MFRILVAGAVLLGAVSAPAGAQLLGGRADTTRHPTLAAALAAGLAADFGLAPRPGVPGRPRPGPGFRLEVGTRELREDLAAAVRVRLDTLLAAAGAPGADTLATYRWTLAGPWSLGAARDTADVAVERAWRAPCPGGTSWANAYRYVFVRDAAGWRLVQRQPTRFSDGEIRCLPTGRPPAR